MSPNKLSYARYEEIKKEIVFMFEEADVGACPIDCFAIAERLHYVLRPYSTLDSAACQEALLESNGGFSRVEQAPDTGMNYYAIYCNDTHHREGSIRWTIFHEIGHIYLGHHDRPPGNERTEEDEANFFAKYAMCPPPLVGAAECSCPQDVYNTFHTSDYFAEFAFNYYQRWLDSGSYYRPYEVELLKRFHYWKN